MIKDGVVSTVAGTSFGHAIDGDCNVSRFWHPLGIAIDELTGIIFVSDLYQRLIRAIKDGKVFTVAGIQEHELLLPAGIAVDAQRRLLYVCSSAFLRVYDLSQLTLQDESRNSDLES